MKRFKSLAVVALFVALFAACSSCGGGGGGGGGGCSSDAECSTYCGFDNAEWRPGAVGSATNGGFCAGDCEFAAKCDCVLHTPDVNCGSFSNSPDAALTTFD